MKLIGDSVFLKDLTEDHFHDYFEMFSPRVQELLGVSSSFAELGYVQQQTVKHHEGEMFFFGIFERKTNQLIGSIEIREKHYRGQLCTWMHEDYWGTGYFQEAFKIVHQAYFKKYPHESYFTARVDKSNKRSYQALTKLGCRPKRISPGPREDQYELECLQG